MAWCRLEFFGVGGVHGAYQVCADITSPYREKMWEKLRVKTGCFSWKLLKTAVTFILVDFAWIFFRADSIRDALYFIKRIFIRPTPWILFNGGIYNLGLNRPEMNILVFSLGLLVMVDYIHFKKGETLDIFLEEQNTWFRWTFMIMIILMIFVFGEYGPAFDAQQFIYFQF